MNCFSTRIFSKFLFLILVASTLFLSCSKDEILLEDILLENSEIAEIKIEAKVIETQVNLHASVAKAANTTKSGLRAIGTPSVTSGKAPLAVTFQGSSTKNKTEIAKWNWKFGDGNTSGNKNPAHTFKKAGTYSVSFEVIGKNGESSIQIIQIEVTGTTSSGSNNTNGFAAIGTPSKTTGKAPLVVSFSGSSSKEKKEIAKWNWNFGDGNTSGRKNPTHTFSKTGTYDVNFEVIDKKGVSATQIIRITVDNGTSTGSNNNSGNNDSNTSSSNEGLKATGSPSTISGKAPLKITFSGNSSVHKKNIEKWNWNFGDGNGSGNKNPNHTFTKAGTYNVSLTVIDKNGKSATDRMTIKVTGSSTESEDGDGGRSITPPSKGNYPSNAVFASSFGFKSGDATDALVKALNSGKSYIVVDKQSSDWIVRPISLIDLRDMTIVFEPGVVLRAKKGAFPKSNDQLFQIRRSRNITIEGYGATFRMNKDEYSSGEHRHALDISKCNGVTVRGLTVQDSGGDGVYIGGMEAGSYSENITIEDVVSKNNRRLGMGIISAQNVWVRNSEFLASKGTLPEAGVALEPNSSSERLVNINFSNCKFAENDHMGFFLSTGKMNSSSRPISVKVSDSEFSYNAKSPNDNRPRAGISLSQGNTTNPVKGEIIFEDILFNGGDHRSIFGKTSATSYRAVFRDCKARNVSRKGDDPVIDLVALGAASTLGGYVFDNFSMEYSSDVPFMRIRASSKYTVKDIKGDFRIKEPNDNPLTYYGSYNKSKNQNVSISYKHIN